MESSIPVVDFSQMSLEKGTDHEDYASESIQQLADEIHRAFSTVGFVYLKNHGIPQQKVREFTEKSFLFPWLYVPDYFIHPIPGHDVHHQWVSDKTTRGYHLDFTGCEKSRDSIGYHCLFWSPSQGDNIWNSPSPPMDEIFWGAGQKGLGRGVLYLWGVYWSWHTGTLCKLTENLCVRSLISAVNFFKRVWWTPP